MDGGQRGGGRLSFGGLAGGVRQLGLFEGVQGPGVRLLREVRGVEAGVPGDGHGDGWAGGDDVAQLRVLPAGAGRDGLAQPCRQPVRGAFGAAGAGGEGGEVLGADRRGGPDDGGAEELL
ncbi:hypothetical protein VR44_36750 [Streptomyces katrae]|uniref:Uncharacterized protein n=1 Tax=Streptomyces katrae TaxID=68223 RepID=A0A0F4IPL0_9ACTN|nr:hypothetical protein VR44_36750 [Streptomyces katrae]